MYSVIPKLHPYKNASGEHLIVLQIIVDRIKLTIKTKFHVSENQFNGKVVRHAQAEKYNYHITKQRHELEDKLLDAFKNQNSFTKQELEAIIKNKTIATDLLTDFGNQVIEELKGKLSEGRIRRYRTVLNKVATYSPKTKLSEINAAWLQKFENYLRGTNIVNATISHNVKVIKRFIRIAKSKGLVREINFDGYQNLKVDFIEPEFLNEEELKAFAHVCKTVTEKKIKIPGYYFLLSCYSGLRLTDALNFDAVKMIKDDELVVYAAKNKKRSGVPLFPALMEVIEFISHNKNVYSLQTIRNSVRVIAAMAKIKKDVKYHTSRHTFCSRMLQLGFSIKDVADMAGDTVETISRTYLHSDREARKKKVKELLW